MTGPDQGFLVSRLVLTLKPWERGWANSCSVKTKCKNCNGTHHVALCDNDNKETMHEEISKDITKQDPKMYVSSPTNLHVGIGGLVALQTAREILRGEREAKVRVLFDEEVIAPL